jgi:DNA-binding response OmpR family regulator
MEEKAGKKILIVEDDQALVVALTALFKSQGYLVVAAYDGTYGTAYARKETPDIIILDLGLPAGGGFFVLENLKASKDTLSIPILVLTAHTEKTLEEKAYKMGVVDFVRKPFDPQMLLDKIKEILSH